MTRTNSVLVPSMKSYIDRLKGRDGEFSLAAISNYVESVGYDFDSTKAKKREIERFCRQIIATYRDQDGDRVILATGRTGEFIDRERCKDRDKLNSAIAAMTEMRDGLNRTIRKTQKQVEGQLSFYSMQQSEAVGDRP